MVLSIIIAAIAAPGLLGSQEAIRQGQAKDKREEHRARRCNLIATCITSSSRSREIDGRPIVLRNGKMWIDGGTEDGSPFGHRYAGYYLPYPDTKYEGLVTTITDVAPIMNWVYVDSKTHEVRYGVRADAQPNRTGPFDCTRQDRRLTFDGWEGWCAVEELPGIWALYFDVDDDGLKSKVAPGTRVLELELARKEKKFAKEKEARQADQTTKREVDAKEDAPFDRPQTVDPQVSRPGVFGFADEQQQGEAGQEPEAAAEDQNMPKTPPPAYSRNEGPEPEAFSLGGVETQREVVAPVVPNQAYVVSEEAEEAHAVPVEPQQVYVAPVEPQESSVAAGETQESTVAQLESQESSVVPVEPQESTVAPPEPQDYFAPTQPQDANVAPPEPFGLQPSFLSREEQEYLTPVPSTRPVMGPPSTRPLKPSTSQPNLGSPVRPPLQTTPSSVSNKASPSERPTLASASSSERRVTPKLNRNSGNRAMSQAQMFDALDAAKKASEDMLAMVRSRTSRASNRGSRANSEAGSVSVYSDDGKRQSREIRPQSSASQVRPGSSLQKAEEIPQEAIPREQVAPEENPRPATPQDQATRQESPSPTDPAIFGASSGRAEKKQETPLRRTKTTPALQRTPGTNTARDSPTRRPGSRVPAPRSPALASSSRTPTRASPAPRSPAFSSSSRTPTRASLASTMSSTAAGKQPALNRTQSTATRMPTRANSLRPADPGRVGPGAGGVNGSGSGSASLRGQNQSSGQNARKTTSTLLRSLDDLVGQEEPVPTPAPLNVGRKPTTASADPARNNSGSSSTGPAAARRGLPLRGNPRGAGAGAGAGDVGKKQTSRDK